MNDIAKIIALRKEPLHEPYPFKLVKSMLQIQIRKVLYSFTPNGIKLCINKTPTCGVTEAPMIDWLGLPFYQINFEKFLRVKEEYNVSEWKLPRNSG